MVVARSNLLAEWSRKIHVYLSDGEETKKPNLIKNAFGTEANHVKFWQELPLVASCRLNNRPC